jgi:hypothetical protein
MRVERRDDGMKEWPCRFASRRSGPKISQCDIATHRSSLPTPILFGFAPHCRCIWVQKRTRQGFEGRLLHYSLRQLLANAAIAASRVFS